MHDIKQDKHDSNRIDYNFKIQFLELPGPPSSLTTQSQLLLTAFIFSSLGSYDLSTKKYVFTTLLINSIYYLLLPMAIRLTSLPPHFLLSKFIIVLLCLCFLLIAFIIN